MCHFEVYIHDDRYSVPTLHLPAAGEKTAVVEWTLGYLAASHHHVWAEIWHDNVCVGRLGIVRQADLTRGKPVAVRKPTSPEP